MPKYKVYTMTTAMNLTQMPEWQALAKHHDELKSQHMRDWFEEKDRFERFSLQLDEILLDYSRNRLTPTTIELLCQLAHKRGLQAKVAALFAGEPINTTENRPALHTALRDPHHTAIKVNGEDIAPLIRAAQAKMVDFINQIHRGKWLGATGKPIQHIVNIGIGGSYVGPLMAVEALTEFAVSSLQFHFIASVDKSVLNSVLKKIDPETTLFIISSKSFSTIETLTNANTILTIMQKRFGEKALLHHFIAITAKPEKALALGIPAEHIFPLWEWVGGRYSIWSAIGLPLLLMIGEKNYRDFLAGAYAMDEHFQQTDFTNNMPVLLALIGIWYNNFFAATSHAIAPYADKLRPLITYLQQATMESNGKSINLENQLIDYFTSPIIFGEEGCNGQHTYHQLLHQGPQFVPVDFIIFGKAADNDIHQDILLASCLSQAQALMLGKADVDIHKMISGNRPSNILFLNKLTPKNLGALLALYEHKIFVQSVIWNINPFDQWGVELGKQLLPTILSSIHTHTDQSLDVATAGIIRHYQKIRKT